MKNKKIDDKRMIESYKKHKHLKIAADEIGMKWQTLYYNLRRLGVDVTGDKTRYGSDSDRLAAKGEALFKAIVPFAEDQNEKKFQAGVDFKVGNLLVDVKTSMARVSNKRSIKKRFGFSLKKQELKADFFVCFGFDGDDVHIFLIPGVIARNYQTMSISLAGGGKWWDYKVSKDDLKEFFEDMTSL